MLDSGDIHFISKKVMDNEPFSIILISCFYGGDRHGVTGPFLQEMIVLYSIAFVGFIARKKGVLNKHADQALTQLVLYITLPALILFSLDISFHTSYITEFLWLISMSIYVLLISIICARFLEKRSHLPKERKKVYESITIFGNQGFIGYAIVYILFQETGIIYLTIFNICYLILIWTYGIYLFTSKEKINFWKNIFLNPGIISTLLGLLMLFSPLSFPSIISNGLEMVGKMTIPLSMIVIGSLMAQITWKDVPLFFDRYLWTSAFFKLLVFPSLLIGVLLFSVPQTLLLIAVIVAGMPSAPTVSLYAQKYGGDAFFAALGVFLTTVLCLVTVPLLYYIVNFLSKTGML